MSKDKLVLIKEKYNLKPVKTEGDDVIYLKGPVAVFGEKNNNNRVYEEKNYLPLLEELQEKIQANNLTGELDHPGERLEVYLTKASHKIEELTYDKNSRTVTAKVRLIKGTPSGDSAIALHKNGVTLGISSRAIGTIKESKALLKKIITFDLVSTPGFKSAMLEQINESVDYSSSADEIGIYEITDEKTKNKYQYLLEDNEDKNNNNMSNDKINKIEDSLTQLTKQVATLTNKFESFSNYNDEHIDELNSFVKTIKENKEEFDLFKSEYENYNENETTKLNKLAEEVKVIDESVNDFVTSFTDYNERESNKLNEMVEHQDRETQKLNSLVKYINENAEKMQSMVEYLNENSDKMEAFVEHQDGETEKLNYMVEFLNNYSTKMNAIVKYLDENADKMENFVDHQDVESKKLNALVEWNEKHLKDLYENRTIKSHKSKIGDNSIENIKESVDDVLNNARKQKALRNQVFTQYPFLQNISESKAQEFLTLDNTRKTMIANAINENSVEREDDILAIWEETLTEVNDQSLVWLTTAPSKYQKVWSNMNESQKEKIIRSANMRNFNTTGDVLKFWDSLNINSELQTINESTNELDLQNEVQKAKKISDNNRLGYSTDYIERIKEQVRRNK